MFRLVPAWYIRTDELRPKLIEAANTVKWEPASNGKRMNDWLNNMGDWNISRKRYYGMPLPFYPCDCGHVTVVGSKEELRSLRLTLNLLMNCPSFTDLGWIRLKLNARIAAKRFRVYLKSVMFGLGKAPERVLTIAVIAEDGRKSSKNRIYD